MNLTIYMPALNEEEKIQNVIENLPAQLDGIDDIKYLVVDDGSTDQTAMIAENIGAVVIFHGRNRGVGAAFQSAVQYALENEADILVGIDADGQFDAKEIPLLIAPILDNKADMVIGNRFTNGKPKNMPSIKYLGNNIIAKLIGIISGQQFQDVSCGFRAYSKETLLRMNLFGNFTYTHEAILSQIFKGMRVLEIPIFVRYDVDRKSRVASNIFSYAFQSSKIILRVLLDYRPMPFFGAMGGILFGIGTLFELFLVGYYILNSRFTPYKAFGFIGLGFIIFGLLVFLVAFIADMINRVKMNQEKIIYELKKSKYDHK
jgi:glycosyltransferase involved in cell wall biosynthesis